MIGCLVRKAEAQEPHRIEPEGRCKHIALLFTNIHFYLMTSPEVLPESMTLKPSWITWPLVMLVGCGLLALSFSNLGSDKEALMIYLGFLLGSGLVMTSLVALWPNSTWIKLGPDGLRIRILFRNIHHRWCDINGLRIKAVQALGTNVAS